MVRVYKYAFVTAIFAVCLFSISGLATAGKNTVKTNKPGEKTVRTEMAPGPVYVLEQAVMCEDVKDGEPYREAIVFPVEKGRIVCFTTVSNIKKKTYISHRWIHKDEITTTKKLRLKPPYWKTFSQIQLRETDKGPWRVEIVDPNGNILKVLRFSVTD